MQPGADSRLYLVVREGLARGTSLTIPPGLCLVGAAEGAGLRIDAPGVAAEHLWVEVDELGVPWAAPIAQAEVTVNGVRIDRRTMLEVGDRVVAGSVSLELSTGEWLPVPGDTAVRRSIPASSPSVSQTAPPLSASSSPTSLKQVSILAPGELLSGRYRVIEKLAAGGMGEVYRVRHEDLDRLFALKVMRTELTGDFVERFRREAVASSRIGHPNIIDITDFGRTDAGAFYFVMEHLEGQTLNELIQTEGALPVPRVLHIVKQLLGALGAAHAAGIVHRDLKPDNVMIVQKPGAPDLVKVLDFGIAKVEAGNLKGGQTGVGVVVGTPQYMSPEQAAGFPVDARSDLYSLALIFYELLAGRPVFNAETPPMMMMAQIQEPPPPLPAALSGKVPLGLERAIFSALAKRAEDRPQSIEAMSDLLTDSRIAGITREQPPPALPPMFAPLPPKPASNPTRVDTPRAKGLSAPVPTPKPLAVEPSRATSGTQAALDSIRRSRRQRNMAFAAVAFVIVAAIGAWALAPEPTKPAPPALTPVVEVTPPPAPAPAPVKTEPVAPRTVQLDVRTIPAGAQVTLSNGAKGPSPFTASLTTGTEVELQVTKRGFVAQTLKVTLDQPRSLEVRLERAPSAKPTSTAPALKDAVEDDLKEVE